MKIRTDFPHAIREIENAWIPMPDGTRLAARIWLPDGAETAPVPAVLEFIPYRKRDGMAVRDSVMHPYFAGHGYAALRVDLRGSGESEGVLEDEYCPQEQADGLAVIEWIAAQPWCSGAVGMIGISWGGFNGLQIAAHAPPALKAIVTVGSTDDRYADDVHYMGGCLLSANFTWAQTFFADLSRPPDPKLVGERWREMWRDRIEGATFFIEGWLRHQHRDAFWRHGSVCEDYGAIRCPVLAVGGWADSYTNAVPRLLEGLKVPRRGLIGPWGHDYPHTARPGPTIDFLGECLRWWDHWLADRPTRVMDDPLLRVFLQERVPADPTHAERPGRWIGVDAWPPAGRVERTLHLGPGGLGDEPVEFEAPLVHASRQTVGSAAGEWCPYGVQADQPDDQAADDAGSLCFETDLLVEPLDLLGAPEVDLHLAIDRPQGFVAARLIDVAPDGRATRISYGLLNLTHRDGHETPRPVEPCQPMRVTVRLCDLGHRIVPGHRIRLALSTAYWPTAWPSPAPVTLTLSAGSRLRLPTLPDAAAAPEIRFAPGEGARPEARTLLSARSETRRHERCDLTGRETLVVASDDGLQRVDAHGLVIGRSCEERYTILPDDPLSARIEARWVMRLGRGDWQVRTETAAEMTATATDFVVTGRLDAYEGETRIAARSWTATIPRDGV